jgi:hypothetical protein
MTSKIYYILYPIPYSNKCKDETHTIYVVQNQPPNGSILSGLTDTLVKKRFYDCDEIIYPIKNPNGSYPYFKIDETSLLLTYLSSVGLNIDTDMTVLARSQHQHALVFYSS